MDKTLRLISEQGDARARIDTLMAQDQTIRRLLRSIDRYRAALEHYADPLTWAGYRALEYAAGEYDPEERYGYSVAQAALAEEEAEHA